MVAIDLGSNSLRGVEWDCATSTPIARFEKVIRTAEGLTEKGIILPEAIERIVAGIGEMKEVLDFSKGVEGVTTEAIRQAKNRWQVLGEIERRTGIKFKLISPQEEAVYTAIAIFEGLKRCGIETQHFLAIDVGGGSTEFILNSKGKVVSRSYRLGIVTLAEKFHTPDRMEFYLKRYRKPIRSFLETIYMTYKKPKIMVGTGGTPTTIGALKLGMTAKNYNPEQVNGISIGKEELEYWHRKLLGMEIKKREELVGIGRGDLIGAGILILREALKGAGFDRLVVSDDGVREGVAIVKCREKKKKNFR